ncbi:MAG: hypothetical protein ACLPX7_09100 [Xanthobacteraceae bacterium]
MTAIDKFVPEDRLRGHVKALAGRNCSKADLIEVMRLVRLVVENERLAETFPHVSLYCDWVMHGEIDRHKLTLVRLEQMNEAIANDRNDVSKVSSLISLAELRAELIVLFASHKVPSELLDSFANWNTFAGVLLEDLCDRPLRLPKKPSGKLKKAKSDCVARMKSKWKVGGEPPWARAVYITLDHTQNPPKFFWNIELESPSLVGGDSLIVKSELQMTETANNFRDA